MEIDRQDNFPAMILHAGPYIHGPPPRAFPFMSLFVGRSACGGSDAQMRDIGTPEAITACVHGQLQFVSLTYLASNSAAAHSARACLAINVNVRRVNLRSR